VLRQFRQGREFRFLLRAAYYAACLLLRYPAILIKTLSNLSRVDLIIIDELGYLALTKQTAKLFFQLISKRYESGSIIYYYK